MVHGQNLSKSYIIVETPKKELLGIDVCHFITPDLYKYLVFLSLPFTLYFLVIYFCCTSIYLILLFSLFLSCLFCKRFLNSNFVRDFYLTTCVWSDLTNIHVIESIPDEIQLHIIFHSKSDITKGETSIITL